MLSKDKNDVFLLTIGDKKSIVLLLYMITVIVFVKDDREAKLSFVYKCVQEYELDILDCLAYLNVVGATGVIKNLRMLSELQKEHLLVLLYEYVNCSEKPGNYEMRVVSHYLREIGLDESICLRALYKTQVLDKLLKDQ